MVYLKVEEKSSAKSIIVLIVIILLSIVLKMSYQIINVSVFEY